MKAMQYAQSLRTFERHCNSTVVNTKEHADFDAEFWDLLGGKPANIKAAIPDDAEPDSADMQYKFWEIKLTGSKVALTEIEDRPLRQEMLNTNNVYILELNREVHIWIGREAELEEKKNALFIGKGFIKQHNKPAGTRVYRIVEKTEKAYFKSFFVGSVNSLRMDINVQGETKAAIEDLASKKTAIANSLLDQLGELQGVGVYLCRDKNLIEIPKEMYGHFFQDDVYLIDIKGSNHRYLLTWVGPRMGGSEMSALCHYASKHTDFVLTVYDETRLLV
jgi:gelsolin